MTQIHWLDPISGYFQTAADWAGGVVPGAADDAILDAAGSRYTVTVTNSGTVNGIDLAANAELLIAAKFKASHGTDGGANAGSIVVAGDGRFVVGGTLTNAGSILLAGTRGSPGTSAKEIIQGSVTLDGGGGVALTGRSSIRGSSSKATLTNVDNTISGTGYIGFRTIAESLMITNQAAGVIDANIPASMGVLTIENDRPSTNAGLIEATAGGALSLVVTDIDNTGGTIAASGGNVVISGGTIHGGDISAGTNSHISLYNGAKITDSALNIALGGAINVTGVSAITTSGVIANAGGVLVSSGNNAGLILDGAATLTGGGTVRLYGQTSTLEGTNSSVVLTNADNTLSGYGSLGNGILDLVNAAAGVIDADVNTLNLTIDAGTNTIANAGLIEATAGGVGVVASAINSTGTLEASGGTLTVNGRVSGVGSAVINGGTLAFSLGFNQKVAFTGTSGVLDLAKSQLFHQAITGFSTTGGTSLDLGDIAFVSAGEATYSGTKARGVLTVTDGTHTAAIHLTGDYLGATFTASSDRHDGTSIVASTTPGAAPRQVFIAAAAGLGGRAGEPVHAAEIGLTRAPVLSRPHTMTA